MTKKLIGSKVNAYSKVNDSDFKKLLKKYFH